MLIQIICNWNTSFDWLKGKGKPTQKKTELNRKRVDSPNPCGYHKAFCCVPLWHTGIHPVLSQVYRTRRGRSLPVPSLSHHLDHLQQPRSGHPLCQWKEPQVPKQGRHVYFLIQPTHRITERIPFNREPPFTPGMPNLCWKERKRRNANTHNVPNVTSAMWWFKRHLGTSRYFW